ncbi:MAG: P-loop NTPase [Desulfurococcaceae archaeon]
MNRLRKLRQVFFVMSSKGGVGKTTISVLLSLASSSMQGLTGLLDLDFVNPSTHVLLGLDINNIEYKEENGVVPAHIDNILYFTIAYYTRGLPTPLHGKALRNILWEVLSIVNWDGVSLLFVDTPPGISDEHLEVLYKLRGVITPVIVTTSSKLSLDSAKNLASLLRESGFARVYLVENMSNCYLKDFTRSIEVQYAGCVPYIPFFEELTGDVNKLRSLVNTVKPVLNTLLEES